MKKDRISGPLRVSAVKNVNGSVCLTAQESRDFDIVIGPVGAGQIVETGIETAARAGGDALVHAFGDGCGGGFFRRLVGMARDALKHPRQAAHAAGPTSTVSAPVGAVASCSLTLIHGLS